MTDELQAAIDQGILDDLIERVRLLPPPTKREREAQALSFAYGNLAASTRHLPCRRSFAQLAADRYGWTSEDFETWADKRDGWRE